MFIHQVETRNSEHSEEEPTDGETSEKTAQVEMAMARLDLARTAGHHAISSTPPSLVPTAALQAQLWKWDTEAGL